jgi:hypothetical protein
MILKSIMAHLTIVVLVVISGALVDAAACTIPPDVTTASFTRGSVYGINTDAQSEMAALIIGKVGRNELNAHRGIQTVEANLPGAEAYLPLLNALGLTQAVTAPGIARTGNLSNNLGVQAPLWNPLAANAGFRNLDGISSSTLNPSKPGSHTPTTTIPRRPPCKPEPIAVPEPSFLLLLGMGLGSLGLVEYRRKKE